MRGTRQKRREYGTSQADTVLCSDGDLQFPLFRLTGGSAEDAVNPEIESGMKGEAIPEIPPGYARPTGALVGAKPSEPQSVEPASEKKETIMNILKTRVRSRGADRPEVEEAAAAAKASCPISKVLKLEIILDLSIEL
jgi:hypothetical protein